MRPGHGSGTLESLVSERGCSLVAEAAHRAITRLLSFCAQLSQVCRVNLMSGTGPCVVLLCSVLERFLGSRIYHTPPFPLATLYRAAVTSTIRLTVSKLGTILRWPRSRACAYSSVCLSSVCLPWTTDARRDASERRVSGTSGSRNNSRRVRRGAREKEPIRTRVARKMRRP